MRLTALIITAVIALSVAAFTAGRASAAPAASTTCAMHFTAGPGLRAALMLTGHPAWLVSSGCAIIRRESGWKAGAISGVPRMVCAGRMRAYPGVQGALFASPAASALARRSCGAMFPRSQWVRFK